MYPHFHQIICIICTKICIICALTFARFVLFAHSHFFICIICAFFLLNQLINNKQKVQMIYLVNK